MNMEIEQVKETIINFICEELSIEEDDLETDMNLGAYGLGSVAGATLTGILEDTYNLKLSPLLVFDYPTIDELSSAIKELV
ncbi:MAG: acyl carrier protein [Pseudomonadota bacterium]